jgi:gamma-glutamylcyclotransferase (GGCT)/AIG2-like uncharacterized protein YtfP
MAVYLFVYGSLRQASEHDMASFLKKHSVYIGAAVAHGRLYEIQGYPGMIAKKSRRDRVVGDLFKLHSTRWVLKTLDGYEECRPLNSKPHEYQRKLIRIYGPKHKEYKAWVYIYNLSVNGLKRIEKGDYMAFLKHKMN